MSKKQTTTATFAANDRVFVRTAATLDLPATGTIEAVTKTGWYVVKLDDSNAAEILASAKGGKVSARAGSMEHIAVKPAAGSIAGMLAAATAKPEAKAPKAPKVKPEPRQIPDTCPECESGELETETDENGTITVSCCSCGWEDTIEPDHDAASRMAEALRKARAHYTKDKRPDGSATAHCGDPIAKELRDYEPADVAALADKVMGVEAGTHLGKYQHLNNGQIRMNSGNRIRAEWKRVNEAGDEAAIVRIAKLLNLVEIDDDEEAGE